MLLQGNKANATDVHSNTARTIGVTRDDAKVLNYGRIYGAGRPFIELLLRKFNPSISNDELERKGNTIIVATKGTRLWVRVSDVSIVFPPPPPPPLHEYPC